LRLFLAINLPPELRREVSAATVPLREAAPELAWVDEPRLHFTLKFIGEQPDERLEEIQTVVARVAGQHRELLMVLGGVGAFPNFWKARVVWLGVAQEARLELLHHDIEVACDQIGIEMEGRPFRPHLTLARIKERMPEQRVRALRIAAKKTDYTSEFIVHSIDLMRSDLSTAGPVYTTLVSAALRSG
jgi:2'-5' RNA ligase